MKKVLTLVLVVSVLTMGCGNGVLTMPTELDSPSDIDRARAITDRLLLPADSEYAPRSVGEAQWYSFSDSRPWTTPTPAPTGWAASITVSSSFDEGWVEECGRCGMRGRDNVRHVTFLGYIPDGAYLPMRSMVLCYQCAPPGSKSHGKTNWFAKWNIGESVDDCCEWDTSIQDTTGGGKLYKVDTYSN